MRGDRKQTGSKREGGADMKRLGKNEVERAKERDRNEEGEKGEGVG